ncbi:glycosyl transferase family 51 [Massilia eurypsychrophila]|uniref:peptidoglycan glycosyltransferase n=1 Tax=Massilia eurypsychrophila TaxID=1485217 RepID=A0A2G8TGN7_9BURK|nr:transglycosylase domain-containing protein [Massilia eurypsychrophila]PIL45212.1 glycosyl transferase family 51 [Massilia eurypsychrophila]
MESNSQAGRNYSVASAVRALRARAASINLGRSRGAAATAAAPVLEQELQHELQDQQAAELRSAPTHLSLVTEPPEQPAEGAPDGKPPKRRSRIKPALVLLLLMLLSLFAWWLVRESQTSSMQAQFFTGLARKISYKVEPGPSNAIRFPSDSPYDERLGYANLPDYLAKLKGHDYVIASQARLSPKMIELADMGLFATYREKTQVGLEIFDDKQQPLFSARFPERVYGGFDATPLPLIQSLLFIENRELLDTTYPKRNPAVEWDRFSKAVFDKSLHVVTGADKRSAGGSTLATQIEKYRHSPDGRTNSLSDKLRQMVSASLRAYQDGEDTTMARRQIVVDYINTVPLSAKLGYGEVNGIGDGMWVWYGRNFDDLNRALRGAIDTPDAALAYKEALSLFIAQRRPAHYLGAGSDDLEELTNVHLRVLAQAGVITPKLRDLATSQKLHPASGTGVAPPAANSFTTRKASNAVRTHLAGLLGDSRLYNVDRLDLAVASTLNAEAQKAVTARLRGLRDVESATAAGLTGKGMLGNGDPANVVYSFTLIERGADANYLRVQTDNYDQPLDINEGAKLDLGSTAKLRTLVTYMDIVDQLHKRYAQMTPVELKKVVLDPKDRMSQWGVEYFQGLKASADRGLAPMLEAAFERKYSASPGESFFTGGGLHTFGNFSKLDDSKIMTVRQALRQSTNLVFVRMMRDVVRYYMFQLPGSSAALLADANDPRRAEYLSRFADREGREFLGKFYSKYKGKTPADAQKALLASFRPTPTRLAAVHRTVWPQGTLAEFGAFINDNLPSANEVPADRIARMYETYAPAAMSLSDRGYVSSLHPLELWVVGYLRSNKDAGWKQVADASVKERQDVYSWLFNTHRKHAQDKRIAGLIEVEAFLKIHAQWKSMGYPFDSLVPSYATTLGASADRPAALAEMMGIIVNNGMRKPVQRIDSLHFAKGTPYETLVKHAKADKFEQVIAPEVAQAVSEAIRGVVSDGTAKRVKAAFVAADGSIIAVGGKTGTGDQRFDVYGGGGRLIESRFVNRSATFVFNIGERFFGSMTAYVHGPDSENYDFTSALPVQLLTVLAPTLMPMIDPEAAAKQKAAAEAAAAAGAAAKVAKAEADAAPGAVVKPAVVKDAVAKPAGEGEAVVKPVAAKPVVARPAAAKPVAEKAVVAKAAVAKPATPKAGDAAADKPKAAAKAPAADAAKPVKPVKPVQPKPKQEAPRPQVLF